jgi:TRAP-type uncharacterized transport system substrate-binding protein
MEKRMKKQILGFVFAVVAALAIAPVHAQNAQHLIVADSSSSGTYAKMLAEIKDVCQTDDFIIDEAPKHGGATDNLDALKNNRVSAAFLHSDVIFAAAMSDPSYKELKTLVALYPEEIHIVTLRTSITKAAGLTNYFSKPVQFNSLSDLSGYNVGAAGGGVITARILTGQGEGHFNVIDLQEGKNVIPALQSGQIQAAIFVGGSPLDNITALNGNEFKLIPIGDSISSRVQSVYRPATINYPNLQSGPIKTMAPVATLVTRKYTRPQMIAPQAAFRACFYAHLDDLKETPGKHPKWALVDPNDHGVWDWYDLPTTTQTLKTLKK